MSARARFGDAESTQLDAVKAVYRRYAHVYDALFGPALQPGRRALLQRLELEPGERVLEVGVGTGLSLPLYPRSVRITGIDVSREMLDKARRRVARRRLDNVEALLEMDAEAMAFPDASFDKVVAMYVVSVVERPARLLEELHRVCKPDGEIFIVNHFQSDNRILGGIEKALSGFSGTLGFRPDLNLREMLPAGQHGEVSISRVNLFWRILRLRNGVKHRKA